ncbi:MAG: hypothetical protein I8H76_01110 [Burkholderiales bacterium]|nr:hypothetical protein [Burkholderiales bacterium]MBH2017138.1 hypothetical protein [Burkholderiales bacterium]
MKLFDHFSAALKGAGRTCLHRVALLGLIVAASMVWALPASAANYVFPGNLPLGCTGGSGSYNCGALILSSGDTIAIGTPKPATITFTSLNASNAQVNVAGSASDLSIVVTGMLTVSAGANIKADVTAGNVSSTGAVSYGGNISTTTGYISLGAGTTVVGALTTTTGAITLLTGTATTRTTVGSINSGGTVTLNAHNGVNGNTVGYLVSAAGYNTFGGSITSTSTYVSLGGNANVNGSIYSQTYVDTGSYSFVAGSITAVTSYIDTGLAVRVGGSLFAGGTYVDIHSNASIGGSIKAQSYVSMTTNSAVAGNVTAKSTVYLGSGSTVNKCVRSNDSASIVLPSATSVGGACCGSGSTCGNTCIAGSPKPAACTYPQSALMAEYRFEETSYNGSSGEAADASGNGNHGRMVGATTSTPDGKICRGILVGKNLDASVAAFDTGLDVNTIGNSGTVAFWYKSITSGLEHRMLFDATSSTSGRFYLYRDDKDSGVDLNFHVTDGGGTVRDVDKLNAFSDDTWAHIAITWQASGGSTRLRLYVNGAQQDEQNYSVPSNAIASAINTLYFGDNRSGESVEVNSANGYMDQIKIFDAELSASNVASLAAESPTCTTVPHHIEVTSSSNNAVTCSPKTFTVKACANADCSTPYAGGISGNLQLTGSPSVNQSVSFSIPAGSATGIASVSAQVTTVSTVTASLTGLSATPSAGTLPYCGMGVPAAAGNSCAFDVAATGLLFDVPNHASDAIQTLTVSAVRSSDNATVCTPAFENVDKTINFKCTYSNPASGTLPVRVADATLGAYSALNASNSAAAACDASGRGVVMKFNGSGVATARVAYADVGAVGMTASYTGSGGDAGLSMSGSDSFIAAPASLAFSGLPSGVIVAAAPFGATVTALNSSGVSTPNFGKESPSPAGVTVGFNKARPTFSGSSAGSFLGSLGAFNNGAASASLPAKFSWTEVGVGDLTAALAGASYLGSGLNATGSTGSSGALGPFIPSHFDVSATNACGVFTYSGQPIGTPGSPLMIRARNATGGLTENYDGSNPTAGLNFAKAVNLSDATGTVPGGWNGTQAVLASSFVRGEAALTAPAFTFTSKLTAPTMLTVRATEGSGGNGVSSSGHTEGVVALRSGRLRLSNVFGTERANLQMPVQTQYWSPKGWIQNSEDNCTSVPSTAVVRARYLDSKGALATGWSITPSSVSLIGGRGNLILSAPSPTATGSVDIAVNLGNTSTDQSCLSSHPASTGANLPWLRSQNGSTPDCTASTFDRDPSARATFGVYAPETNKTIYIRDLF